MIQLSFLFLLSACYHVHVQDSRLRCLGLVFLSGWVGTFINLLKAWPVPRLPMNALRTFGGWGAGWSCHSRLYLRGMPSCFSEEVAASCSAFLRQGWKDSLVWHGSPVCISISCLLCWLASAGFASKLLLVLWRRGARGTSGGSVGSLPTPWPRKACSVALSHC